SELEAPPGLPSGGAAGAAETSPGSEPLCLTAPSAGGERGRQGGRSGQWGDSGATASFRRGDAAGRAVGTGGEAGGGGARVRAAGARRLLRVREFVEECPHPEPADYLPGPSAADFEGNSARGAESFRRG